MEAAAASSGGPDAAEAYEAEHVHAVYEAIAPHFSSTRHKPWPRVAAFLERQPAGSVGVDVGCGNGKYLGVNRSLHVLGSDRSAALVGLAREKGQQGQHDGELCVADGLALPYRRGGVDFALCIAVIHHLSTRARRRDALAALLECVRPAAAAAEGKDSGDGGGQVLVYVWALEQSSTSRRQWGEGSDQDTLVPWVMRGPKGHPNAGATYQRYYHLYREGELEEDVAAVGGHVVDSGYDQDNWWVVCSRAASSESESPPGR